MEVDKEMKCMASYIVTYVSNEALLLKTEPLYRKPFGPVLFPLAVAARISEGGGANRDIYYYLYS